MMRRNIIRTTLFCLAMILCGLAVYAGETADAGTMPEHWVGTYTQEEIDAIERALWAANLTLEDLNFRKDYTEGYECFPIVREWLHKPMEIAPGMDGIIAGIARWREKAAGPIPEVLECLKYYPDPDEKIERVYRDFENGTGFDMREIFSLMPGADNTDKLKNALIELASANPVLPFTEDELEILREYAPMQMAWHDVFESPYDEARRDEMKALVDKAEADFLYKMMSRTNIIELVDFYLKNCPYPGDLLEIIPHDAFPSDEPLIFETEFGRIGIGTFGDDRWEGDFTVLLDPGGNDYYLNCRIGASFGTDGRRFGWFADLGGDDIYDSRDIDITMGAAVLGVAAFYDLGQGNDRYFTGNCTLGASVCGVATFYDDGGSDIYEGKAYTMGAAGFGIGVMVDASLHDAPDVPTDDETPDPINVATFDNDQYNAWTNSQAFARTLGFAVCSNERGNDNYHAGGVYLHAPLFADRYQSFSQGFAIGERGIDYAGGIAFIIDYDGNDRYLGDVYNQGVGYWYSAGLLYDGAGNDTYEMTQYGQGSGIHLAVGGLIDCSGNDSYTLHAGLGTGGSHDYASSVLHDRGGNDQYFGNTSCMGGSLTNSSVIFIDRSGNDTYAGRREGGINFGRPERGFISIGVLIDLDGNDDYLGIMDNGVLWRHTSVGVGWDVIPEPVVDETEAASVPVESEEPSVALPEIINYEGELTEEVFKELWDISCRWEVGDNRYIVPHARDKLIAFGSEILPYLSKEFDNQRSGLAIRAFDVILAALLETDRDGVIEVLRENLLSDNDMRRRVAMAEIITLKTSELENEVAKILDDPDPAMQRRAMSVLGALGSHVADDRLIENLKEIDDESLVKVSMETLFALDVYIYDAIRPLLDHPYVSVRETLIGLLRSKIEIYGDDIRRDFIAQSSNNGSPERRLSIRAMRSLMQILATAEIEPDESLADAVEMLLDADDWGVRADAVRIVNRWKEIIDARIQSPRDPSALILMIELMESIDEKINSILEDETDPFVLFVAGGKN